MALPKRKRERTINAETQRRAETRRDRLPSNLRVNHENRRRERTGEKRPGQRKKVRRSSSWQRSFSVPFSAGLGASALISRRAGYPVRAEARRTGYPLTSLFLFFVARL